MSLSKLLIPVDGSVSSLQSLDVAVPIAKAMGSQITVIHVMSTSEGLTGLESSRPIDYATTPDYGSISIEVGGGRDEISRDIATSREQRAESIVSGAQSVLLEEGLEARTDIIRFREPAEAILELAYKGLYDLIVMGNGEDDRWESGTVGSVAMEVARKSSTSVLIVKQNCGLSRLSALIPEDCALPELAVEVAKTFQSSLNILVLATDDDESKDALLESVLRRATSEGLASSGATIKGDRLEGIKKAVERSETQTLVIGRPRAGALGKILHKNQWTYNLMMKCPCSVLLTPRMDSPFILPAMQ